MADLYTEHLTFFSHYDHETARNFIIHLNGAAIQGLIHDLAWALNRETLPSKNEVADDFLQIHLRTLDKCSALNLDHESRARWMARVLPLTTKLMEMAANLSTQD